jgi:hypothetical protein
MIKAKSLNLLLAATLFFFFSCKKDNVEQIVSSIEFSFGLNTEKSAVKNATSDVNITCASVVVSIETMDGTEVVSNKRLLVNSYNNNYKSQPLLIDPGTYKLTKFLVVDNEETVREVVPIGFTHTNINDALPIVFEVQNSEIFKIALQTALTDGKTPQDFGYVSFSLNGQNTFNFLMTTRIFNSGTQKLENTNAHISIENESVSVFEQDAADTTNILLNEAKGKYIITVSKDGYNIWKDTLSANAFARFKSMPLSVLLQKPSDNVIRLFSNQDTISPLNIGITRSNTSSKLLISWGDGIVETSMATSNLNHTYAYPGIYKVNIVGNVEQISQLTLTRCRLSSIDLSKASNLASINISRNYCLHALDLSEKPNLKEVYCVEGRIESINLNNSNNIETFYCSMNNLTNLDVTNLKNLKSLYCDRNALSSLNVSNNTALQSLCCYQNMISALDISNNVSLVLLECRINKLVSLDFSKNPNLSNISLTSNDISNQQANSMMVNLLQNVRNNPRSGAVNISFLPTGSGETAINELKNTYKWSVE